MLGCVLLSVVKIFNHTHCCLWQAYSSISCNTATLLWLILIIYIITSYPSTRIARKGARWWRSWLRHCARGCKVEGSIPDVAISIFHPSGRTVTLVYIQCLTEMSIRNIPWGVKPASTLGWQFTTFIFRISGSLGASNSWIPQGINKDCFTLRNKINVTARFVL